jgi:serine/threonine protein kinase
VTQLALAPATASESLTTIAGRYHLLATLNEGSDATVLRAHDSRLSRAVAIKVRALEGPTARRDFEAEVQTMVSLSRHPGLLHLYDAGIHCGDGGETGYITTELMATTMASELGHRSLGDQQIARVGRLVGQALAHMHERHIAHHAVTPANVLLVDPGAIRAALPCARLAGFSSARTIAVGANAQPSSAGEDVRALGVLLLAALVSTATTASTASTASLPALRPMTPLDGPARVPQWLDPAWRDLISGMCALEGRDQLSAAEAARQMPLATEVSNVG